MKYIKTFTQLNVLDYNASGVLACDIALLNKNNIQTPLSFVITSDNILNFLENAGVKTKIDFLLSRLDYTQKAAMVNLYNTVRKLILEAEFPQDFEEELREVVDSFSNSLNKDGEEPHLLVVLSVNYEPDVENNEGIIQNVIGFEELLVAIKENIAMLYTPDVLYYRRRNNIPEREVRAAILVENMIYPRASAYVYSSIDGDYNSIKIYAYSGCMDLRNIIKKDSFLLSKEFISILHSKVILQDKILLLDEDEKIREKDFFYGEGQKINDKIIMEIARLAKKSEKLLGVALKQFYAVLDNEIYLLLSKRMPFALPKKMKDTASEINRKEPRKLDIELSEKEEVEKNEEKHKEEYIEIKPEVEEKEFIEEEKEPQVTREKEEEWVISPQTADLEEEKEEIKSEEGLTDIEISQENIKIVEKSLRLIENRVASLIRSVLNEEPSEDFAEMLNHAYRKKLVDDPSTVIRVKEMIAEGKEPNLEQVHEVLLFLEGAL